MRVLVLAHDLLPDALQATSADDDVIAISPHAHELEELEAAAQDPRVAYLIGDGDVLPLPDAYVEQIYGGATEAEARRVIRP